MELDDWERRATLYPFGPGPHPVLGRDIPVDAPVAQRVRSAWAFLVQQTTRRAAMAAERGVPLDAEELLQSAVAELVRRDHLYDPARGKYTTFCKVILRNVVADALDRAGPVRLPARCRKQRADLERESLDRELTAAEAEQLGRIRAAMAQVEPADDLREALARQADDGPLDRDEDARLARDAVARAVRRLDPQLAYLLGRSHGLFGGREASIAECGRALGLGPSVARALLEEAIAQCREELDPETRP
jgi:hypothetical protein